MITAFDTLVYAKKLREAGFTEQQAEVQAEALRAVIDVNLATKQDIALVQQDIALVRRDMKELEAMLRREMKEMDTELRQELKQMQSRITLALAPSPLPGHRCTYP